jgi:hypothetical protein
MNPPQPPQEMTRDLPYFFNTPLVLRAKNLTSQLLPDT